MALSAASAQADDAPPAWAYAVNPPDFKVKPDDGTPQHVPDSTAAFTVTQARDLFFALDWHPSDHPPLPDIVAHGRKPDVMACGVCHRADGPGGPENASLAGLPAQYIVQQMADFKSGARTTSVPQRIPPQLMIKTAKGITDAEIEQAAAYFSGLKPRAVIKSAPCAICPIPHPRRRRRDRRTTLGSRQRECRADCCKNAPRRPSPGPTPSPRG
jgi:cytochrome c553